MGSICRFDGWFSRRNFRQPVLRMDDREARALLGPMGLEAFRRRHWRSSIHHGRASLDVNPSDVFSTRQLEAYLFMARPQPHPSEMVVVREGIACSELRHPDEVLRAFAAGHTISLKNVHERWPSVASVAASLARLFDLVVRTNVYLSRSGVPGLPVHYDRMDVIVLQTEGSKAWSVLPQRSRVGDPAPSARPIEELGPPLEVVLEPGDVLYIPRGHPHRALCRSDASCHVTFSLDHQPYLRLLRATLDEHPLLEPEREDGQVTEPGVAELLDELRSLLTDPRARDRWVQQHRQDLERTRALPGRYLETLVTEIDGDTRLTRRRGLRTKLREHEDHVELHFGRSAVRLDPPALDAARMIDCSVDGFVVADLVGLGSDRQLELARRLVDEGLLELAGAEACAIGRPPSSRAFADAPTEVAPPSPNATRLRWEHAKDVFRAEDIEHYLFTVGPSLESGELVVHEDGIAADAKPSTPDELLRRLAAGAVLLLNDAHRRWPLVGCARAALSEALEIHGPASIVVRCRPSAGPLPIVQTQGRSTWSIDGIEQVLEPGDVMVLPDGLGVASAADAGPCCYLVLHAAAEGRGSEPYPSRYLESLLSLGDIRPTTQLRRRGGLRCVLEEDGDSVALRYGARVLRYPASLRPTARFLVDHRRFVVEELPGLTEAARARFAAHLVEEGLLEQVGP
jgi:lysine-specific demethylase/histidyl-hydroxylase NO66